MSKTQALSSSFTPQQREYIDAAIEKRVRELAQPVVTNAQHLFQNYAALQATIADLQARVDAYESKYLDDQKYSLTRPKIVSLMKKLGID